MRTSRTVSCPRPGRSNRDGGAPQPFGSPRDEGALGNGAYDAVAVAPARVGMEQLVDESIYERLTTILREVFDDDSLVAQPELRADDVARWDSFGHLRLIFTVERVFGVDFAATQVSALKNIGELATLISHEIRRTDGEA